MNHTLLPILTTLLVDSGPLLFIATLAGTLLVGAVLASGAAGGSRRRPEREPGSTPPVETGAGAPPPDPNTCSGSDGAAPGRDGATPGSDGATVPIADVALGASGEPVATPAGLTPEGLTPEEEFDACELIVDRYVQASLDAGYALRTIRDKELFRLHAPPFDTFTDYVPARWPFDLRRAEQLTAAATAVDEMAEAGVVDLPLNEAQVRPIASLDVDERVRVWAAAVEEYGSADALSLLKVKAAKDAVLGRVTDAPAPAHMAEAEAEAEADAEPDSDVDPTRAWAKEARRALKKVPKKHRPSIAALIIGLSRELALDVTPELVAEAIEGFTAAALEDGLDEQATLVGEAATIIEAMKSAEACVPPTESVLIPDLDILDDATDGVADPDPEHAAATRRSATFIGTDEQRPLLISVPRVIAPPALTDGLPPNAKQVIVELGEYERLGGPVSNGVLDLDEFLHASREARYKGKLHRTNAHVDWARYTSNPETGCYHSCRIVFCYAAGIAKRLFAQGFLPTLYPARLDHFRNTRLPDVSGLGHTEAWRERSVFMVSMGDLFGSWIPAWYIERVLDEIRQNPGWFVFFLTKNPSRLGDFAFPPNCAVGLTITGDDNGFRGPMTPENQLRVYRALAAKLGRVEGAAFTWLSIEPFREPVYDLTPFFEAGVQMVAVGGQSRTAFCAPLQPEIASVDRVRRQVRGADLHLFEKENLTVKPKEIPFPDAHPSEL